MSNLCISILEFKLCDELHAHPNNQNLCISILEFKFEMYKNTMQRMAEFMYFYIRI